MTWGRSTTPRQVSRSGIVEQCVIDSTGFCVYLYLGPVWIGRVVSFILFSWFGGVLFLFFNHDPPVFRQLLSFIAGLPWIFFFSFNL